MPRTRARGITIDGLGRRTIDKAHRGERIFARLGAVSQDEAERRLAREMERLEWALERRIHARPLFSDCAKRFLLESKYKCTAATLAWHVEMLLRYVGDPRFSRIPVTALLSKPRATDRAKLIDISRAACKVEPARLPGITDAFLLAQRGFLDYGFMGGAQIDQHGNINTSVVGSDYWKPRVRLPGTGGANDIASLCKEVIILTAHEKRRFVEHVDFITSPGWLRGRTSRRESGLGTGGMFRVGDQIFRVRSD